MNLKISKILKIIKNRLSLLGSYKKRGLFKTLPLPLLLLLPLVVVAAQGQVFVAFLDTKVVAPNAFLIQLFSSLPQIPFPLLEEARNLINIDFMISFTFCKSRRF